MKKNIILVPFILLFGLSGACRGDKGGAPVGLQVDEGWVRAMPLLEGGAAGTNSAAYLVIENDGPRPDRLTGGSTPAAERLEIHESTFVDDVMRMRRVEGLDLGPGTVTTLSPGGVHLMLLGLNEPLVEGEKVSLTLHFQEAGDLTVVLPVRAPGSE